MASSVDRKRLRDVNQSIKAIRDEQKRRRSEIAKLREESVAAKGRLGDLLAEQLKLREALKG